MSPGEAALSNFPLFGRTLTVTKSKEQEGQIGPRVLVEATFLPLPTQLPGASLQPLQDNLGRDRISRLSHQLRGPPPHFPVAKQEA